MVCPDIDTDVGEV
jgi:hypothetical protein